MGRAMSVDAKDTARIIQVYSVIYKVFFVYGGAVIAVIAAGLIFWYSLQDDAVSTSVIASTSQDTFDDPQVSGLDLWSIRHDYTYAEEILESHYAMRIYDGIVLPAHRTGPLPSMPVINS
jgi:hypothetical protein